MALRTVTIAALVLLSVAPASASVTVLGSSNARLCFEAADSAIPPSAGAMHHCDSALAGDDLTRRDEVATYVNRGILRLRRDRIDEAVADFDAAIGLDPEEPEAYLNKGAALIRQRHPADAVPLFTVALERRTSRPALAFYGRGVANEQVGNLAAAYRDYRRASELDPQWPEPRLELARFRVQSR